MMRGTQKFFLLALLLWGIFSVADQKKLMKILVITATFPKISSICVMNQATGLIDRGHDVRIFAFSKGDCVNVQEDVMKYDLINKAIFELPASLDDYDIVMFQLGHKLFDIRKTHNFKGRIVVCLRGYDITGFLRQNPHGYDHYFKICDLFLPVCKAFKQLAENAGCDPHKIIVHHSSIDCSKFKFQEKKLPRDGKVNILSAGRFVEKKGFIYSIRAIAQLIKKYPNINYTIIGEGALKNTYKKLIKKLGVGDKIKIDGWHTHEEYTTILDKAHIFIAPSVVAENNDQEGIANVLKEAMAMGVVVIATDHSGNSELIDDGISGFIVPERDSHAIGNAVEYIVNNSDSLSAMQLAAAHKIHSEFEKERENDKLEAIFYELLKEHGNA